MKSRLVALALAAVMTLGSCMSASAKDVFTKYMIGGTVVKNGSYVESVKLIDVDLYKTASKNSLYTLASAFATPMEKNTQAYDANNVYNNAYQVAFASLTTTQQQVLLRMIQEYGQSTVINTANDTSVTAPYRTGTAADGAWDYNTWVSRMQIAPYAERYIVALNYKKLYTDLKALADAAVAQGQITASDAFSNTTDLKTAKDALGVIDLVKTRSADAGDNKYSGAEFQINGTTNTTTANMNDVRATTANNVVSVFVNNIEYAVVPATLNIPSTTYARYTDVAEANGLFFGIPVAQTTLRNSVVVALEGNKVVTRIPKDSTFTYTQVAGLRHVNGDPVTPLDVLRSYLTYTGVTYQETVENALEVAKEMQKSFDTAAKYYDGQIKEGVAYLINCVRPDLADVKAANIDTTVGFDMDPWDELKWNLKETKTIAFTSPSINDNMKETQSCVVLHFNTTACKWESIPAKFVKYNGVLGIEGEFTSCSPVIVVTLKDYVDNGAAAAATATDAKKSPHTGEEF